MKKRQFRLPALMLLAVAALLLWGGVPVDAANKALQVPVSFKAESKAKDPSYNTISVSTRLPKATKLKNKMTISGKIYVPKSIYQVPGDTLLIGACLDLENEDQYAGGLRYAYWICLQVEKGKPVLRKLNDDLDDLEGISKVASVKTSGKFYVITLKKVPVAKTGLDALTQKETTVKQLIAKNLKYKLLPTFTIHGDFCLKVPKSNFYFDDVTLKTDITQKETYSKKSVSENCLAIRQEKEISSKVTAIK